MLLVRCSFRIRAAIRSERSGDRVTSMYQKYLENDNKLTDIVLYIQISRARCSRPQAIASLNSEDPDTPWWSFTARS